MSSKGCARARCRQRPPPCRADARCRARSAPFPRCRAPRRRGPTASPAPPRRSGGEHVQFGTLAFEFRQDLGASGIERPAAQPRVEIVRRLRQRRGRQALGRVDQAVLDLAVLADHDHHRLAGRDGGELDMFENGILLGRDDEPGAVGEPREQAGRLGQDFLEPSAAAAHPCLDRGALVRRQLAHLKQSIDEQPEALLGGRAAGAGVRRIEQAHGLQIGHDVADRGRRQGQRQALGQGARTHRLAARQEGFHQMAEDLPGAVPQDGVQGAGSRLVQLYKPLKGLTFLRGWARHLRRPRQSR